MVALTAAIGAAGASAAEFGAEKTPTTVASSGGSQYWSFRSVLNECGDPKASGTLAASPSAQLETGSSETIPCTTITTGKDMKMNGCKFIYHPGTSTGAGSSQGTVEIGPTGCGPISFTGGAETRCVVTVPAQTGLNASYSTSGTGSTRSVKVSINATNITHTQVSGKDCGGNLGTYTSGKLEAQWTLSGTSGGSQSGIYIEGVYNESPPVSTSGFAARSYPATLTGGQDTPGVTLFKLKGGNTSCSSVSYSSSLSGPKAQLAVAAVYSGCLVNGISGGTVNMNGCTYTFNVLNQPPVGSTYAGHADIACPAGKAIELVARSGATVKCTT